MKNKILNTSESFSPLIIRIMLGIVVFPHGAQKLFGWFGGYGFTDTMAFFTDTIGLPWIIGFLVIISESIGAIALILGLGTRLIAIGYSFLAIGIIITSHIQYGFFMDWFDIQQGEGYEYFILWLGMAFSLVITGSGIYSIDGILIEE